MAELALFTARKIFKQVYPATYNFKDDEDAIYTVDAEAEAGITFVDTANIGAGSSISIVASLEGHRKVLKMTRVTNNVELLKNISSSGETTGTYEFWVYATDSTKRCNIITYEDATNQECVQLAIDAGKLQYFTGGAFHDVTDGAIANNTLYHIKVVFDCVAHTFDVYIDGDLKDAGLGFRDARDLVKNIRIVMSTEDGTYYIDAFAYSWDTDYKIGDNVFWRHYFDQDSDFESEDVGTTSDSIGWVSSDTSGANCGAEIIAEFNEHKKVMQVFDDNAAAAASLTHTLPSTQTNGTVEYYIKTNDATQLIQFALLDSTPSEGPRIYIYQDKFQYYDGAFHDIGLVAVDDIRYHIKIDFECGASAYQGLAADTFYIWINNIRYGAFDFHNNLASIRFIKLSTNNAANGLKVDFDAISYSWNNEIADNRTFDYLPYTYNDITANIVACEVAETEYEPSTAIILDDTQLSITDLHIIQLYDENSDLRFEGLKIDSNQPGVQNKYYLKSLNSNELDEQTDYTASSAGDVNSHLLLIHPNVGQENGRLIYYTEDDPAGDITPNYRNRPTKDADRWLAAHGNKVLLIKPNGVCFLDSDRDPSNGAVTITGASTSLMAPPFSLHTITNQINLVEVWGASDPLTGTPFNGISEDATAQADGTGILKYYKRFRELQSNADCASRALKIRTGTGFNPQLITIQLKSIYALPGEIINFAYSDRSFSATDCFVESAIYNLVQGLCSYTLNTGIFDAIGIGQPQFSYAAEGSDDVVETLRATDAIILTPVLQPGGGAIAGTFPGSVELNAIGEFAQVLFYIIPEVDDERAFEIFFQYVRRDANNDAITISRSGTFWDCNSSSDFTTFWPAEADTLDADSVNERNFKKFTIPAADANNNSLYGISITMNEAGRDVDIENCIVKFFLKRIL